MRARWILGLAVALSACGGRERGSSALLVTLDTTRADAVGVYGGLPGITPSIDRLAREGITWAAARTVAPLTLPAHASMLTGLYPPRHGIRGGGDEVLPAAAETLAETARAAGFATAAFVAASVLGRDRGLAQGFDVYAQPERLPGEPASGVQSALAAEEITARAVRWLEERAPDERPFFLWVHYFDPHEPRSPPEHFLERTGGDPYLAEVARVDAALGQLIDALAALGALERTLVAVVGDHGESRGEHGERTHGQFVYESALRVPLVVRPPAAGPGSARRGSAERGPASVVDVYPTLARAMGLAPGLAGGRVDGIDLLAGPVPEGRGVYFECYYGFLHLGWSPLAGWADARAKYVHSSSPEFYVPDTWSDERVNRIHERPREELDAYRARLAEVAARPRLAPDEPGARPAALPGPLDETGLPSPHARAAELELCDRARALVLAGDTERGIAVLEEILALNPRNTSALETLVVVLERAGRPEDAALWRDGVQRAQGF